MDAAGHLAHGIQARHVGVAVHVDDDAAAGEMGRRHHLNQVLGRVDTRCPQGLARAEALEHSFFRDMPGVHIHAAHGAAPSGCHLLGNGGGQDVTGGHILQHRVIALHEPLAVLVENGGALTPEGVVDQLAFQARRRGQGGGHELDKLHVPQAAARLQGQDVPLAGESGCGGGVLVESRHAAGGQHHRLGGNHQGLTLPVHAGCTAHPAVLQQQLGNEGIFQHGHALVSCPAEKDAVGIAASAGGTPQRPGHRVAARAEAAVAAVLVAVELHAPLRHPLDSRIGPLGQTAQQRLVHQLRAAAQGVRHQAVHGVVRRVGQHHGVPTCGHSGGVAARLVGQGHPGARLTGRHGRAQSGAAAPQHQHISFQLYRSHTPAPFPVPRFSRPPGTAYLLLYQNNLSSWGNVKRILRPIPPGSVPANETGNARHNKNAARRNTRRAAFYSAAKYF